MPLAAFFLLRPINTEILLGEVAFMIKLGEKTKMYKTKTAPPKRFSGAVFVARAALSTG